MVERSHSVRRDRIHSHAWTCGLDHSADLAIDSAINLLDRAGELMPILGVPKNLFPQPVGPERGSPSEKLAEQNAKMFPAILLVGSEFRWCR